MTEENKQEQVVDAETETIIDHHSTDSTFDTAPLHSSTPTTSVQLPLWYRSYNTQLLCLACFFLLIVLNILSLSLDKGSRCPLLFSFQIVSTVVYGIFFFFFLVVVLAIVPCAPDTRPSYNSPAVRLAAAVMSGVCYIVLIGLVVLSFVSLILWSTCTDRVLFMFVTTLDVATPFAACTFLVSYALLCHVGQYRQKHDEGVDLSLLSPSLFDLHLVYYALAVLLCSINVSCAILHAAMADGDGTARLFSWIAIITYAGLSTVLAITVLVSLVYRLSLSPTNQHRLVLSTIASASQELVVFVCLLCVAWVVAVFVNGLLILILFFIQPSIGGMSVVGWLNQIANTAGVVVVGWEVRRHWELVRQVGEAVWLRLFNEGMATGVYARDNNPSWQVHVKQPQYNVQTA